MNNESLRRAAILISSLDTESADALLDEMSPSQAASIRNAVMQLDDIDIVEQQEVIREFVGEKTPPARFASGGVEIIPDLARKFQSVAQPRVAENHPGSRPQQAAGKPHQGDAIPKQPDKRPFSFLESVEPSELARVLANEHPQTTAIVVAHLAPSRAAAVLEHLPPERQADALIRIARLNIPHPDIIHDLEHEMQDLLTDRGLYQHVESDGVATVNAILQNAAGSAREGLVANIAQQDKMLANRLGLAPRRQGTPETEQRARHVPTEAHDRNPDGLASSQHRETRRGHMEAPNASTRPRLAFSDLERMDNATLSRLLRHCSSNTLLLALVGASPHFTQRIAALLPPHEGAQLEQSLQQIGPLRLDDIQRAQNQLIRLAEQLDEETRLASPENQRLSVAA